MLSLIKVQQQLCEASADLYEKSFSWEVNKAKMEGEHIIDSSVSTKPSSPFTAVNLGTKETSQKDVFHVLSGKTLVIPTHIVLQSFWIR